MGIRRRIEITAFRRATIVFRDQSGDAPLRCSQSDSKIREPVLTNAAQAGEVGLVGAELATVDDARSSELTTLFDALVENEGNSAGAARQLDLSLDDFISKLCGFGFSRE